MIFILQIWNLIALMVMFIIKFSLNLQFCKYYISCSHQETHFSPHLYGNDLEFDFVEFRVA